MKLSDIAIRRPVTTAMIAVGLLVFGILGVSRMPVDVYPNVTLPMVVIATVYPGAGPLEVESGISSPIEQRVGTISNVKDVTSRSTENLSIVQLQFEWGTDLDAASADVRDRLDQVAASLPSDASRPFILKFDPTLMPILQMGMFGDIDPMTLRDLAEDFADGLQRVPGVAAVSVAGGTRRQVQIQIDRRRLAAAGITNEQLVQTLKAQNLNFPVGSVSSLDRRYIVRLIGEYADVADVAGTVVGVKGGTPVLLRDVADVSWQPEETETRARINGQNCVFVVVQRRPDANTVRVAAALKKEVDRLRTTLPSGVDVNIFFDSSIQINRSISNVATNILIGGILAVMVLFLFLRRFRATMFVAFSIPVSIFFALFFMFVFGFTINVLSLAGLAIAVGMVVDNGIVAFESVFRRREQGDDPLTAASVGVNEIAMAITASTLTTAVVFLPMLLVRGLLQVFFKELVWAVTGSLLASLAVALTLIPMLSSRFLKLPPPGTNEPGLRRWSERAYAAVERAYARLINWAVGHRRLVVGAAVLLFIISLSLIPFVGREFMPGQETWFHTVTAEMPVGTSAAKTDSAVARLERYIQETWRDDLEGVSVQVGGSASIYAAVFGSSGSNVGTMNLILKDRRQRKHSIAEIDAGIRHEAASIPGLRVRTEDRNMTSFAGGGAPIEIDIIGHDLATADSLTRRILAAVETIPGLVDLKSSREPGKPEIQLVVDRQKAALFGLTPFQIGSALRTQVEGNAASQFRLAGREYDILLRLRPDQRSSIADIAGLAVNGPTGAVPLGNLVSTRIGTSPLEIEHRNTARIVRITGKAVGISAGQLAQRVGRAIRPIPVPAGFDVRLSGSYTDMVNTFKDLGLVVLVAVILVFMVMASQFESLRDPFIIMFTVPFGLIGVIWALFITRTPLSVTSGLGVLVLMGIVVNNGIVYIDYCNQLRRKRGMNLIDAVKEAGRVRLRPILMTSLTTIFGLIPLALQLGEGSELWSPLGRAIIGGMVVSTFLPLVFIPVLYVIFETRTERARLRRLAATNRDERH
uniref:Efflux RND transporter permease subunit n=1 Tax=candidate division WOR-3 bacterium TaxID=2052148 RepID=A0A7C4GFK1_UNCW3